MATPFGQLTNSWDAFRQQNVNDFNASLAQHPDWHLQPMTFTPGNYSAPSMPQTAPAPSATGSSSPAPSSGAGMSNPYLGRQANALRAQQAQLFGDMNNQIRSNSIGVGGLGGSRQGVAQGVAMGRAATGLDSALAGMYGNAYEGDQNRALSQYQGDQDFYNKGRGLDQSGAALGGQLWSLGNAGQWGPLNQANNVYSPYTGFGQTTQTGSQGGGLSGAIGGALGGAQLGYQNGWWGK